MATFAVRTQRRILTRQPRLKLAPTLCDHRLACITGAGYPQQLTTQRQVLLTRARREQAVVADTHEPLGKNVQQETAQKLLDRQGHLL